VVVHPHIFALKIILTSCVHFINSNQPKQTHMKNIIRFISILAAVAIVFSSCASKHGMAYNKNLKNNGKCLLSSEGCGWAKK
jgi:hypothetical protein